MTTIINARENRPNEIWLQWHGWQPAIKAGNLHAGDVTVWNGGVKEIVRNVEFSKSGKTVSVTIESESGHIGTRKLKTDRLVGIA